MSGKDIRISQLIAPFGPGSIYIDNFGTPLIVGGLDHWMERYSDGNWVPCENKNEFLIAEGRLSSLLEIPLFYTPPYYSYQDKPNNKLKIPVMRFPTWYTNRSGELKQFTLHRKLLPKGEFWKPVRFVAFCTNGHITDFPWKQWIDCKCESDAHLTINDFGGADLNSIRVNCTNCKKTKTLRGATSKSSGDNESPMQKAGIHRCNGHRPWLGENTKDEECQEELIGALISQTNLYYSKQVSSIFIPPVTSNPKIHKLQSILDSNPSLLSTAKNLFALSPEDACDMLNIKLKKVEPDIKFSDDEIKKAFQNLTSLTPEIGLEVKSPSEPESSLLAYRRVEFNCISAAKSSNEQELKVINSEIPKSFDIYLSKINLVSRLRETKVFLGFDRLEPNPQEPAVMAQEGLRQLYKKTPEQPWLPAIKSYGEGIFIELKDAEIDKWISQNKAKLMRRIDDSFVCRLAEHWTILSPAGNVTKDWALKYLLIHTLSHVLIKEFVYQCGYSTAALKERLYISSDTDAPMSGVLIYTASGDSEGSLGGLVKLGHAGQFEKILHNAIQRSAWCSTDPVCSEKLGATGSSLLNLSACQACSLLPETACEAMNNGLDRALLVGTAEDRKIGFFSELLEFKESE
jgi:hypothetical protein